MGSTGKTVLSPLPSHHPVIVSSRFNQCSLDPSIDASVTSILNLAMKPEPMDSEYMSAMHRLPMHPMSLHLSMLEGITSILLITGNSCCFFQQGLNHLLVNSVDAPSDRDHNSSVMKLHISELFYLFFSYILHFRFFFGCYVVNFNFRRSFSTISAVGDHAASPHYDSEGEGGARKVALDQVYLLDSGAHYRDGTTDVTRTIWLEDKTAVPEDFIKQNTLVLKGHIHLADTIFPQAVTGVISRIFYPLLFIYLIGLAGIGHRIMQSGSDAWIREGMVITIEPGFYLDGKWGIRIENCYENVN
uniref:Peptidase_M24 domain-containing protein n=1 Tax=Heterorhabditis bacteriophora TaxID=37862 RepID=A0A1I7W8Y3_HETBA